MTAVEIWFRGEGVGVPVAKPGGHLHDFGDGVYLIDREDVAKVYAIRRAPTPADQRVWMVAVPRQTLGNVLDLTLDSRWHNFMSEPLGGRSRLHYLQIKHELYDQFFREFLQRFKLNIKSYDAVIGPEYNLGGNQLCILHKNGQPAKLALRIRAMFRPVTNTARMVMSKVIGKPQVNIPRLPSGPKVAFARAAGGTALAIGLMLVINFFFSKAMSKIHQRIIDDRMKALEPEIQKTVSANKGFIVHTIASGKPAYAVVTVTVLYFMTLDISDGEQVQSVPAVTLDKVIIGTEKINGAGKERTEKHMMQTAIYQPYTFSSELTVSEDDIKQYGAAIQEQKRYEEMLKSEHLTEADKQMLTKEKNVLEEMIRENFY